MNRLLIVIGLLLLLLLACEKVKEQSPLSDYEWSDEVAPNRKGFSVAQWYGESTGKAKVGDKVLTYWLYDTYTRNNGDGDFLIGSLEEYVENLGWCIDYDNVRDVNPNNELASSVKTLMTRKGADVSFTYEFYRNNTGLVWINNYNKSTNIWSTFIYDIRIKED